MNKRQAVGISTVIIMMAVALAASIVGVESTTPATREINPIWDVLQVLGISVWIMAAIFALRVMILDRPSVTPHRFFLIATVGLYITANISPEDGSDAVCSNFVWVALVTLLVLPTVVIALDWIMHQE